jgi:UDP-3-O-[3-hydroxymyristoyl] glucosamine N-acyltransferase
MKAREIAEFVGGELHGDGDVEISSVADILTAVTGDVAFFEKTESLPETNASCVILPIALNPLDRTPTSIILVKNPKLAFAHIAQKLHPINWTVDTNHPTALIAESASVQADHIGAYVTVGENSYVGEGCRIHDGVRIGSNVSIRKFTIIHSNCVIYDNVEIGDSCVIHSGVVVGADGFGYVRDEAGVYHKFPQIGTVVIEDDVEIGANTCIDRGALGETRIGEGTKIDNLVQVGHNVSIGKRCVIAAQTGISGSVVIEDDCVIGGQVGFGDHVHVKSGAIIGSQAGILPGKIVRPGIWWGTPIQPLDEYKRQNAHVKGLQRLKDDVKELKKRSNK